MTDTNYHMAIWIGISIGIGIAKIFSSVLDIESIGKKWYQSTLIYTHTYIYIYTYSYIIITLQAGSDEARINHKSKIL